MNGAPLEQQVGQLQGSFRGVEAQLSTLTRTVGTLAAEVRELRSARDQSRGGWKLLLGVAALASGFGSLAAAAVQLVGG